METTEKRLLNIKANPKHCAYEFLIKKYDPSQDLSRAAIFERAVKAARDVTDWNEVKALLGNLEEVPEAPLFTNMQARYSEETGEILTCVQERMIADLGLVRLQSRYMVLLLQANYLETLKKERVTLSPEYGESEIDIPEMAKLFCRMTLSDKDCPELAQIRRLLVSWRDRH